MSEMSATWKAALWVGVVFLLGTALGGTLGYSYAHHPVSAANMPLSEPARRSQRVEQLTQALGLTSAQSQQVDAVLLQRHTEAKAIHDQADAQLDQVHQRDASRSARSSRRNKGPSLKSF